jgi:thiamine-phosphate pyrophosphorylase
VNKKEIDYRLCLVTDRKILKGRDLCRCVEAAIEGGVTIVQLRGKTASSLAFYETAKLLKNITAHHKVPLIINDRLDIALAVDAGGLHLGQEDLPLLTARKLFDQKKIIGVSVCTVPEALLAQEQGADYLGVGAMFSTPSKKDARLVSLATLKAIKESVNIPVVAIGGIGIGNLGSVMTAGIDGVAVISAILQADDCRKAAAQLCKLITKS